LKSGEGCFPEKDGGGVRLVASRSIGSEGVANGVESQRGVSEYKLHIMMDKESFMRLRWLKTQLEASTEAEVIRRALKAYELFAPDDETAGKCEGPNSRDLAGGNAEHLYIRIPLRMKERLDIEHRTSGRSYGEQVRQALRVLTQLSREVEKQTSPSDKGVDGNLRLKLASIC
jgi:hypothetical protein